MLVSPAVVTIPPPRPVPWTMKPLSSAIWEVRRLDDGRLTFEIQHEVLRGVSPRMLVWWFNHLEGDVEIEGRTYPSYLIWHPVDHIRVRYLGRAPDGRIGPGARIHIQEALGGDPRQLVDIVARVEKLDETGFAHAERVAGVEMARIDYTFTACEGGTLYWDRLIVGTTQPVVRPLFNRVLRPRFFPETMGHAWIRHNVEEVGNFEFFLPALYARHVG